MPVIHEANLAAFAPGADLTGKTWAVRIIEGDKQGSSAFYPRQVLEANKGLFAKGTRVYADHPTLTEQEERPVRSINDLVGFLAEDASYDGKDLNSAITFLPSKVDRMRELAEAGLVGLSIRALGDINESGALENLQKVLSVDVVTEAGAGGALKYMTESSASESGAGSHKEEQMDEIKEALAALVESNKALAEAIAEDRKARKEEADKALAEAAEAAKANKPKLADVVEAADKAELSAVGRKNVLEAFEAEGDWQAVLEAEKAREDEIRESIGGFNGGRHQDLSESEGDDPGALIFG